MLLPLGVCPPSSKDYTSQGECYLSPKELLLPPTGREQRPAKDLFPRTVDIFTSAFPAAHPWGASSPPL